MGIVSKAAELKDRYRIPYVDSIIGATALLNQCKVLYTSDRTHMAFLSSEGIEVIFIREDR